MVTLFSLLALFMARLRRVVALLGVMPRPESFGLLTAPATRILAPIALIS